MRATHGVIKVIVKPLLKCEVTDLVVERSVLINQR